jgi:tetratricopeptide (TPR) repeat protein
MKLFLSFLIFTISVLNSVSQELILEDSILINRMNKTIDLIYNFEFDDAYLGIDTLEQQLGDHPALHLLRSMIFYWRDRPFKEDTDPFQEYQRELETAIELATSFQENEDLYEEGEFYILAGYGLLTDFYNSIGQRMKAVGSAKKAYNSLKEGFELKEKFPDFYFSSGVYNYYREKFPELHPFYKTFLWVFVNGDMEMGLEQLKVASEEGVFTQREALIYLFHIYLRYENKPDLALPYSQTLVKRFPGNTRFKCLFIESMIYNNNDSISKDMIDSLINHDDIFYQLAGNLFSGLISEKEEKFEAARYYLRIALEKYEEMGREDGHYLSLIYTGMARLAVDQEDNDKARKYYKLALKTDPYVPVRTEAERFLRKNDDG